MAYGNLFRLDAQRQTATPTWRTRHRRTNREREREREKRANKREKRVKKIKNIKKLCCRTLPAGGTFSKKLLSSFFLGLATPRLPS